MKNKKELINRLKYMSLVLTLSTSIGLSGCGKNNTKFSDTMRGRNNSTCFDELIGDDYFDLIDEVEKYVIISNKLNNLKLEDNTSIDDYIDSKLLKADEILSIIACYSDKNTDNETKDNLRCVLYVQNKLVNSYIRNNGYGIIAKATLLGLKARIADAASLDEKYASSIRVMDQDTFNSLIEAPFYEIYIGDYDIAKCGDYMNLLNSVYKMQNNENLAATTDIKSIYNKDRNKYIIEAINNLRICMSNDYKVDSKNRIRRK